MAVITNYVMRKNNKYASTITLGTNESLILIDNIFQADKLASTDVYYYHDLFGYDIFKVDNELVDATINLTNVVTNNDTSFLEGDNSIKQLLGNMSITSRDIFGKKFIVNVAVSSTLATGTLGLVFNDYPNNNLHGQTAILQGTNTYQFIMDFTNINDTDTTKGLTMFLQLAYFTGSIAITDATVYILDNKGYTLTSGKTYLTNWGVVDSNINITSTTDFNSLMAYDDVNGLYAQSNTGYDLKEIDQTITQLTEEEIEALKPDDSGGSKDPDDPANKPAEPGFNDGDTNGTI